MGAGNHARLSQSTWTTFPMAGHSYASGSQLVPSRQVPLVLQCGQMRSPSQSLINSLRHFRHRRCLLSCSRSGSGFSLLMLQESGFQNSFILSAWWRIRSADIPPSALGHLRQRRRPPQSGDSRGSRTSREGGQSSSASCHGFPPRSELLNPTVISGGIVGGRDSNTKPQRFSPAPE